MKYLVLLAVLAAAFGIWNNRRRAEVQQRRQRAARSRPGAPQPMVACAACGLHLPRTEAASDGQGRWYCQEHRP
ncbi:PP0621 family protein [Xylophilus sp.]|uniref:PP0621 family protein n=1 Tax=Xylophilus sp. TaxID=2653893 RepID=UPI0013BB63CC|nr:PP0621 family protein [Xylophilus sp.]KAF1048577.1 MAG: hypothetical protein GAK38_01328 [Xylophilus sp.]